MDAQAILTNVSVECVLYPCVTRLLFGPARTLLVSFLARQGFHGPRMYVRRMYVNHDDTTAAANISIGVRVADTRATSVRGRGVMLSDQRLGEGLVKGCL